MIGLAVRDPSARPQALAVLRKLTAKRINPAHLAELYITLGDVEAALAELRTCSNGRAKTAHPGL